MRPYEIIRQKRRFEMFSENSKEKVLELNAFFGKYTMTFEAKLKKMFVYYDTPNRDLEKSNIVLFKTVIGNMAELNMATERTNTAYRYAIRNNYKHYTIKVHKNDTPLKHKEFLIENFKNMFLSSVNFDPEFLMRKLEVAYIIQCSCKEYRSTNVTGLKITYSFDNDIYTNMSNGCKVRKHILTIYQHSPQNTDDDFENLISKLSRYLKELTFTTDTKIKIARRETAHVQQPIKKSKKTDEKPKK